MWGIHSFGWGIGMLIWLLFVWVAVALTTWFIFDELSGRHRHVRH